MNIIAQLIAIVGIAMFIPAATTAGAVDMLKGTGPRTTTRGMYASSIVLAVMIYLATPADSISPLISGALAFICSMIAGYIALVYVEKDIAYTLRMARPLQEFALSRFQQLDRKGDGSFGSEDVRRLLKDGNLTPHEQRLAVHLRNNIYTIGHEAGILHSYSPMTGAGGQIPIFRVSREDLTAYPDKVERRYASWSI